MPSKLIQLRCDRNLLDSNFEGYKLSLSNISASHHELSSGVRMLHHPGDDFSYLYLELLSMQNHLIVDPWNENNVYYVDDTLSVIAIVLHSESGDVMKTERVFQIPTRANVSYRYNVTVIFISSDLAVICDGADLIYVLSTDCRSQLSTWTVEFDDKVLGENVPFTSLDARYIKNEETEEIHCLLIKTGEKKKKAQNNLFWMQLKKDSGNWTIADKLESGTMGSVKYGHLSPDCKCSFIECTESLKLVDGNEEVVNGLHEVSKQAPSYYWQQTVDEIKIWLALPVDCAKERVKIDISDTHVCISFDEQVFLSAATFQRIDSSLTTWNIVDQRIEVTMSKREEGQMWRYLFENDDRGEEIVDPALVDEIHEKLAHLTADAETCENTAPVFNAGQLEACDRSQDENARMYVVENAAKKIIKEVDFSNHKVLFNLSVKLSEAPYLCSRHDVDGVLWKLDHSSENVCQHVATLNAFGYVLASKEYKFCICSPDFSYAAITATSQNVFLYKQNCSVDSELRNRKNGRLYADVGKQFLITLQTSDEILGVYAGRKRLVLLTKTTMNVYNMEQIG